MIKKEYRAWNKQTFSNMCDVSKMYFNRVKTANMEYGINF